jgi:hypothetical protein
MRDLPPSLPQPPGWLGHRQRWLLLLLQHHLPRLVEGAAGWLGRGFLLLGVGLVLYLTLVHHGLCVPLLHLQQGVEGDHALGLREAEGRPWSWGYRAWVALDAYLVLLVSVSYGATVLRGPGTTADLGEGAAGGSLSSQRAEEGKSRHALWVREMGGGRVSITHHHPPTDPTRRG